MVITPQTLHIPSSKFLAARRQISSVSLSRNLVWPSSPRRLAALLQFAPMRPNQTMQPTDGRRTASLHFMKTLPVFSLAPPAADLCLVNHRRLDNDRDRVSTSRAQRPR